MGQNAHSTPATRAGLRNNLGEQGRSSRARKPQLNGEWVTVWERWQATPRTHEAAQRAARTMPAKYRMMGCPRCCQGFRQRHRKQRAPQVGCPKYITPDDHLVPSKIHLAPFGPGKAAPTLSSDSGQDRSSQPEQRQRQPDRLRRPTRPTPTANRNNAGIQPQQRQHPPRLPATPPE